MSLVAARHAACMLVVGIAGQAFEGAYVCCCWTAYDICGIQADVAISISCISKLAN